MKVKEGHRKLSQMGGHSAIMTSTRWNPGLDSKTEKGYQWKNW